MDKRGSPRWFSLLVIAVDIAVLYVSFLGAFYLRFLGEMPGYNLDAFWATAPAITIALVIFYNVYGLQDRSPQSWDETLPAIISASLMTFISSMALSFFLRGFGFPRTVFALALVLHLALSISWRRLVWSKLSKGIVQKVLLVGNSDEVAEYSTRLGGSTGDGYSVVGAVLSGDFQGEWASGATARALGLVGNLPEILPECPADVVLVCPSVDPSDRKRVLRECFLNDRRVLLIPDFYDIMLVTTNIKHIDDLMVFDMDPSFRHGETLKRLMDVALSLAGLLVTLPLMALIALAVVLDSPGGAIYRQRRVGENGRVFYLCKFRTMRADAERTTGPVFSGADDLRVTRVGRILRASRLDELPQLWNVLKGDMSLVGPRPERPFFVEKFEEEIPEYALRHKVKAGLTGLAQVSGKYSTPAQEKLRYDLYYLRNSTFIADVKIILHTLRTVLTKRRSS